MPNLAHKKWKRKEAAIFLFVLHAALPLGDASVLGSEKQEIGPAVPCLLTVIMSCDFKRKTLASFHVEWWVRISITTQYNNIYVTIKQLFETFLDSLHTQSTVGKMSPGNVMTVLMD